MTWRDPTQINRSEARERALELAYSADQRSVGIEAVLGEEVIDVDPFVDLLLRAESTHRDQAVELMQRRAKGWSVERMALLDRLVMRLAIAELLATDTPTGVVLAEWVDLAGRYSTEESSRFVNGVLAAAARELRPGQTTH